MTGNYFFEQLRTREEVAREEWERARVDAPDPNWPGLVEYIASLSFAEFFDMEFSNWINSSADDCMRSLGTYDTPALAVN